MTWRSFVVDALTFAGSLVESSSLLLHLICDPITGPGTSPVSVPVSPSPADQQEDEDDGKTPLSGQVGRPFSPPLLLPSTGKSRAVSSYFCFGQFLLISLVITESVR